MAVLIKEERCELVHFNCDVEEEFLLPLEDPLAFDDNCGKAEDRDEPGREDVGKGGITQKSGMSMGTQTQATDLDLNSTQFKGEEKKIVLKKRPKAPCYICKICHLGFHEKDLSQEHLNTGHSDVFKFPCRHCGKKFQQKGHRRQHEKIHDKTRFQGEPRFACDKCDRKYHLKCSLESHVKLIHLGIKPKRKPRSSMPITEHHAIGVRAPPKERVENVFQCPKCDLKFGMRSHLVNHMKVHSDVRIHKCPDCDQSFKNLCSKYVHIRKVHQNQTPTGIRPSRPRYMSGQPCVCKICGKEYAIPSRLNRHMTIHSDEKSFECKICGNRYKVKGDMLRHLKCIHTQNNMMHVKCVICGKEFKQFSLYNQHRKTHGFVLHGMEKEKAFGCFICKKPFFTRAEAAVCTVFGHDPSSLRKQMFRFKCSMCPTEMFGYHSLIALRKHWKLRHDGIPLPWQYRAGMYDGHGNEKVFEKDVLPKVVIPRAEATKLRETGISPVKLEHPLYVEFDLVQVEEKFLKKSRKRKETKNENSELILKNSTVEGTRICSVNVNDELAILSVLGNRILKVQVSRLVLP